jgi:hypothetical protein
MEGIKTAVAPSPALTHEDFGILLGMLLPIARLQPPTISPAFGRQAVAKSASESPFVTVLRSLQPTAIPVKERHMLRPLK